MLSYDKFKDYIIKNIVNYLPEAYKGAVPGIEPIKKTNIIKEGLKFSGNNLTISPVIYVDDLYKSYTCDNDINKIMDRIVNYLSQHIDSTKEIQDIVSKIDKEMVKDNVFIQVINTTKNIEKLKELVSRKFLDLSIIYRVRIKTSDKGIISLAINNSFMEYYGFKESDLYNLAFINTKKMFPFQCSIALDILSNFVDISEIDDSVVNDDMLVLSNSLSNLGAHVILYQDELLSIANKFNSDFYIIPSSIHELLVKPLSSINNPDELKFIISKVNATTIPADEFLSNNLYLFSKDTGKITIV